MSISKTGNRITAFVFTGITCVFASVAGRADAAVISWASEKAYITYQRGDNKPFCRDRFGNAQSRCPITKGFSNFKGGSINTDKNSSAWIECRVGGGKWIPKGSFEKLLTELCPQAADDRVGENLVKIRSRKVDQQIPYIVAPRYTLISNSVPDFRWNSVSNTAKYTVMIFHDRSLDPVCRQEIISPDSIWRGIASVSYAKVCGDYQLKSNYFYKIIVQSDTGKSSTEEVISLNDYRIEDRGLSGLGFRLLDETSLQEISQSEKNIILSSKSEEEKSYRISTLYGQKNIYSQAISILEELVNKSSSDIDIYVTLGDYYAESGLSFQAKSLYEEANKLVANLPDDDPLKYSYEQNLKNKLSQILRDQ
jgi:hypothetical protein